MGNMRLMPIAGINNVDSDEGLQIGGDSPRLFVRDARNLDITPEGQIAMRPGARKVSELALRSLWQSSLHGDVFGALGDQWVRVGRDWSTEPLAAIGDGEVSHIVLNNSVLAAGTAGLFRFDGTSASRLTIDTPPSPMLIQTSGALEPGTYGVAVSWLRGTTESGVSEIAFASVGAASGLSVILPAPLDTSVTHARLYVSKRDSGELGRAGDYEIGTLSVELPLLPALGAPPTFPHCDPMPTGRYLGLWRGRIVTAKANVLRFSEPMGYHVHNQRHGFVLMPQRITFVAPVDGGLWVGQVDHVAFLAGSAPGNLELSARSARRPIPGTAIELDADDAGSASQGGRRAVVWLADNGHVIGTPDGQIIEPNAGRLRGIAGDHGSSVVFGGRVLSVVR